MSTPGQAVGGVLGAVAGFFIGGGPTGAMYGAQAGMMIGGYLDPVTTTTTGPRLTDLKQQVSTYGAFIPRVYGTLSLTGNVFWLENNSLKEVTKKTKSSGKGGPSVTSETYSYYATFAVGLCKGPIAGVRRIWVGANLIYDAGSSDMSSIIASNSASSLFTLHLGTNTQAADDRMQAALGVANTPAYRGLAYIVLKDFPLEDYGNSLMGAQVKVEVVQQQSFAGPVVISNITRPEAAKTYGSSALHMATDSQLSIFWCTDYSDPTKPTLSIKSYTNGQGYLSGSAPNTGAMHIDGWSDTPAWATTISSGFGVQVRDDSGATIAQCQGLPSAFDAQALSYHQRGKDKFLVGEKAPVGYLFNVSGASPITVMAARDGVGYGGVHDIFLGESYNYAVSNPPSPWFVCYDKSWNPLWSVSLAGQISISHSIGGSDCLVREEAPGQCVLRCGTKFIRVNRTGYSILGNASGLPTSYEAHGGDHLLGNLWISYGSDSNKIAVVRLEPTTSANPTLSSIVQAECLSSGTLKSADIDTTALTQTVKGYKVSNAGSIRSALEPLQGAWPFDPVQRGYTLTFKPRGSASVATISAGELAAEGVTP